MNISKCPKYPLGFILSLPQSKHESLSSALNHDSKKTMLEQQREIRIYETWYRIALASNILIASNEITWLLTASNPLQSTKLPRKASESAVLVRKTSTPNPFPERFSSAPAYRCPIVSLCLDCSAFARACKILITPFVGSLSCNPAQTYTEIVLLAGQYGRSHGSPRIGGSCVRPQELWSCLWANHPESTHPSSREGTPPLFCSHQQLIPVFEP